MTIRGEEKRGDKKAAQPPSYPFILPMTGCHPERRHEAKDLVKVNGCLLSNHILVCMFFIIVDLSFV
jgi:hypothetical protein